MISILEEDLALLKSQFSQKNEEIQNLKNNLKQLEEESQEIQKKCQEIEEQIKKLKLVIQPIVKPSDKFKICQKILETNPSQNIKRQLYIMVVFKNNKTIKYQVESYFEFTDLQDALNQYNWKFKNYKIKLTFEEDKYEVPFKDLMHLDPGISSFNWPLEKFELLEEFLMTKKFFNSQNVNDFKCKAVYPNQIMFYMQTLNFEGTFYFYKAITNYSMYQKYKIFQDESISLEGDFIVYPQVIKDGTRKQTIKNKYYHQPSLSISIPRKVNSFLENIDDYHKEEDYLYHLNNSKTPQNYEQKKFYTEMISQYHSIEAPKIEKSMSCYQLQFISTQSKKCKSGNLTLLYKKIKDILYGYNIIVDKNLKTIELDSEQINQVMREAIISEWNSRYENSQTFRIPGKGYNENKSVNDRIINYNQKCFKSFILYKKSWFKQYGFEITDEILQKLLKWKSINQWELHLSENQTLATNPLGLDYILVDSSKLRSIKWMQNFITQNIDDLTKYYVGIDTEDDIIWEKRNRYQVRTLGTLFGNNNDLVYHYQMSIEYTIKLQSSILMNYKKIDFNPFEQGQRFSFYDFVTFKRILHQIHKELICKLNKLYRGQAISEIYCAGELTDSESKSGIFDVHATIFESLEDERDSTFKTEYRLAQIISSDNDYTKLNFMNGVYFTPNFLQNFDYFDTPCEEILRLKISLSVMMLGFNVTWGKSGNVDQQASKVRSVVKYNCCVGMTNWAKNLKDDDGQFSRVLNQQYEPCPFYVRYQRLSEDDPSSSFALHDYNICHSHPLIYNISYPQKLKHTFELDKRNYQKICH